MLKTLTTISPRRAALAIHVASICMVCVTAIYSVTFGYTVLLAALVFLLMMSWQLSSGGVWYGDLGLLSGIDPQWAFKVCQFHAQAEKMQLPWQMSVLGTSIASLRISILCLLLVEWILLEKNHTSYLEVMLVAVMSLVFPLLSIVKFVDWTLAESDHRAANIDSIEVSENTECVISVTPNLASESLTIKLARFQFAQLVDQMLSRSTRQQASGLFIETRRGVLSTHHRLVVEQALGEVADNGESGWRAPQKLIHEL